MYLLSQGLEELQYVLQNGKFIKVKYKLLQSQVVLGHGLTKCMFVTRAMM